MAVDPQNLIENVMGVNLGHTIFKVWPVGRETRGTQGLLGGGTVEFVGRGKTRRGCLIRGGKQTLGLGVGHLPEGDFSWAHTLGKKGWANMVPP